MWAAYNGHPQCVALCLKYGANIAAVDDDGSTALHWALVKGNYRCIQKLVEYGSDRFAESDEGKTPAIVAKDMGTEGQWWRALRSCGYEKDGSPMRYGGWPFLRRVVGNGPVLRKFYLTWPGVILGVCFWIFANWPIFFSLPLAVVVGLVMHVVAVKALVLCPTEMKDLEKTVSFIILEEMGRDGMRQC